MDVHFSNADGFHFLWFIPVIIMLYVFAAIKRKQALAQFADIEILKKINVSVKNSSRLIKLILLCLGWFFIVFAVARPGWDPKPKKVQRQGRDVVFVLDVSKSMLAEDLKPNRLERAKLAVTDCVDTLEGDRVALVAFAGTAVMKCPLTVDYTFFRSMVDDISVNSINRGGTNIGDAIRLVLNDVFDDQAKKYKDIILITDGEDHDTAPEFAAEEAGKRGVRILTIGLGDENTGRRIPVTDSAGNRVFMTYQDKDGNTQEVWSRLDADMLRKIANLSSGGNYLNVATGTFDLGAIYKQLIASAEKKELEAVTIEQYDEKFQFFLFIGLFFIFAETFFGIRKRVGG